MPMGYFLQQVLVVGTQVTGDTVGWTSPVRAGPDVGVRQFCALSLDRGLPEQLRLAAPVQISVRRQEPVR